MDEEYFRLINSYSCPIPTYEETKSKLLKWLETNNKESPK